MQKKIYLPIFVIFFLFITFFLTKNQKIFAQTATDTPTTTPTGTPDNSSAASDIRSKIAELEGKITDLKGQEKSLSSQISVMDSQIKLTEYRVTETESEIKEVKDNIVAATNRISKLETSLDDMTKIVIKRIQTTYEEGDIQPLQVLMASGDVTNYVTKLNYMRKMQAHDKKIMYAAQQAKNDYANQKVIFEDKEQKLAALQDQLEDYTKQLDTESADKKTLLSQTQGSEANYQRLLSQAKAQLAGFSQFTVNQGGAGLLSGQTTCDDWGCYYNQRDTQWGGASLNGTQYTIASDGCLITAMAMVMTHYGHKTTPLDINSNSDNFASYYPAYLLYTISANGTTAQRVSSSIDSALSNGDPVVVGVHAYGGTHFVVLRSGSGGNYMMNDPYVANGNNIPFSDHYAIGSIFEIDKVVI